MIARAALNSLKNELALPNATREKVDALEISMHDHAKKLGYRRADAINRSQDFMANHRKRQEIAKRREDEWLARQRAREAATADTAGSLRDEILARQQAYVPTIDDAVVEAAQYHPNLTKEEGDTLLYRIARRDPMRTVRIDAESDLRPPLFSYRRIYEHPLKAGHGKFENDQAMRALSLLPARWRCRTAAIQNKPWCIEELYMTGFDCDYADEQGWTPLHLAAARGHVECVNVLVHVGAKVNSQTVASVTPLFMARAANSVGACQILQAAGAVAQIHDVPHGAYEGHRTILDVDVLGYVPRVRRQIDDSRANLQQLESSQRWSTGSLARPDLYDLHNLNPR